MFKVMALDRMLFVLFFIVAKMTKALIYCEKQRNRACTKWTGISKLYAISLLRNKTNTILSYVVALNIKDISKKDCNCFDSVEKSVDS